MEPESQENPSADLKEQFADLKADLAQIKQLLERLAGRLDDKPSLTEQSNLGYSVRTTLNNQGKNAKEKSPIKTPNGSDSAKSAHPPYVDEGHQATCTRCGHTWIPFVRRPKKCPSCRQPWYKPKAWLRNKHLVG